MNVLDEIFEIRSSIPDGVIVVSRSRIDSVLDILLKRAASLGFPVIETGESIVIVAQNGPLVVHSSQCVLHDSAIA